MPVAKGGCEEKGAIDQSAASDAFLRDPNVRFPQRPQFVRDVEIYELPYGLGFQFRGGTEAVVLRGCHAVAALKYLANALDGQTCITDILKRCPGEVPLSSLIKTLTILHVKGLLREADEIAGNSPSSTPISAQVSEVSHRELLYWGRKIGVTGYNRFAEDAQRRITSASIVLVGTGMFGLTTYDLLSRSGCKNICLIDWNDDRFLESSLEGYPFPPKQFYHHESTSISKVSAQLSDVAETTDLIICATRNGPVELFRSINRISLSKRCPVIFANDDGNCAEIGPYVYPFRSSCFTCMEIRRGVISEVMFEEHFYQQHLSQERSVGTVSPVGEFIVGATMLASFVVAEAVRAIARVAMPCLADAVVTLDPLTGELRRNSFLRVPRCPDCSDASLVMNYANE